MFRVESTTMRGESTVGSRRATGEPRELFDFEATMIRQMGKSERMKENRSELDPFSKIRLASAGFEVCLPGWQYLRKLEVEGDYFIVEHVVTERDFVELELEAIELFHGGGTHRLSSR